MRTARGLKSGTLSHALPARQNRELRTRPQAHAFAHAASCACAACTQRRAHRPGCNCASCAPRRSSTVARGAPAPPPATETLLNQGIKGAAIVLAVILGFAVLNAIRASLRSAFLAQVNATGAGGLMTSILGLLLNIVGVDLGAVESGANPSPAGAAAKAVGADKAAGGSPIPKDRMQEHEEDAPEQTAASLLAAKRLAARTEKVHSHFHKAISADDFLARVEVALAAFGFRRGNTLALTDLCRDESTGILKSKIDEIFGSSFNINGLGGVLTCGVTGIGAGLSHAPVSSAGRERYVFFAFPHIAVDELGEPAAIFRPGRSGKSSACGALLFATNAVKEQGLDEDPVGIHKHNECEASILLNRIKRQIRAEGQDPKKMDVVELTKLANRVITRDLNVLIEKAIPKDKAADYAVVTGIQIHSWPRPDSGEPVLEFVEPTNAYVVVNGERKDINLLGMPPLTPRQLAILAAGGDSDEGEAGAYLRGTTVTGVGAVQGAGAAAVTRNAQASGGEVPAWAAKYSSDSDA